MQLPWKRLDQARPLENQATRELGKYKSGDVSQVETLEKLNAILNPNPHWTKNMVFSCIVGVALMSAASGAYLAFCQPSNEKTLQTAGLLLTGSLTGLIGIVAGSKI